MMPVRQLAAVAVALALTMLGALPVHAIPLLQLYVEGATYDHDHESWVFENPAGGIKLWVIGNVSGPDGKGIIKDVKLSVVYPDLKLGPDATITLWPSQATDSFGFTDPSLPHDPGLPNLIVEDGSLPQLHDGKDLAKHGTYGSGWEWQEFSLGDFYMTDSPVADFIDSFPSAPSTPEGQINAYEISVPEGITDIHFDAYGYYVNGGGKQHAVFAPLSHDAGTGTNNGVPEPTTLALLGLGLAGLGFARRSSLG